MTIVAEVDDVDGAARCIGNYLNMQSYRVNKYIMSASWVFPGWIGFSQRIKKEFGAYPKREILVDLSKRSIHGLVYICGTVEKTKVKCIL
jgi:hypothetical protein